MISNMYSYFFVHTLHCMGFSVSSRKEELHCVLRLGCRCYICKRWFLLILRRAFCPLEGGGPDILTPGLQLLLTACNIYYKIGKKITDMILLFFFFLLQSFDFIGRLKHYIMQILGAFTSEKPFHGSSHVITLCIHGSQKGHLCMWLVIIYFTSPCYEKFLNGVKVWRAG